MWSITAGAALLAFCLWLAVERNSMKKQRVRIDERLREVDTALNEYTNLMSVLMGAVHDNTAEDDRTAVLLTQEIALSRQSAHTVRSVRDRTEAFREMRLALQSSQALAADRPELKTDAAFNTCCELAAPQKQCVTAAMRAYNKEAAAYDCYIKAFPHSIAASVMQYKPRQRFDID